MLKISWTVADDGTLDSINRETTIDAMNEAAVYPRYDFARMNDDEFGSPLKLD